MQNDAAIVSARPANNDSKGALYLLLCAAWILPGLFAHDPWKPDEAHTFGLVYNILQGGSWIVPTLADEPYLDKPPLFILTAAAFAKLASFVLPLHDGARLASGFYMAIALALIAASGRRLYGAQRGPMAALLVLSSFGLLLRAHQLIADTALFAGIAAGAFGLSLLPHRSRAGGFALGTGIGMAFMAKGMFGPVVLIITTLTLALSCREWRHRDMATGSAVAVAAALPWFVVWPLALYLVSPGLFSDWLWSTTLGRLASFDLLPPRAEHLGYLALLPWYAWPSLPLALWVLWGTRVSRFARREIQLPAVLFASCLLMLSLPGDTRELHAMPLLIPIGLLAAPAIDSLRRGAANAMYWFGVMGFTFFAAVAWFYWGALELGLPARLSAHLHRLQPAYDSHVRWAALAVGLCYTLGWIALIARLKRSQDSLVIVWAAGMTLIWGLLMSLFVAYADASKSYRGMIAGLVKALPPTHDCISSRALGDSQRAMLHYHGAIVTYREEIAERQRSCELLLVQGRRSEPPEIPAGWHQVWEGTRPGEKEEYFWLYGYGPPPSVY